MDNKRLFVFVVLSIAIWGGFLGLQFYLNPPKPLAAKVDKDKVEKDKVDNKQADDDDADAMHAYLISIAWEAYRAQQAGTTPARAPVAAR